jgi:hypothetical protein
MTLEGQNNCHLTQKEALLLVDLVYDEIARRDLLFVGDDFLHELFKKLGRIASMQD